MMSDLHTVLLENSPEDAKLILEELKRSGFSPRLMCAADEAEYRRLLCDKVDVVIAESSAGKLDALTALGILREHRPDVPFIVLSGSGNPELIAESMRGGASDYVMKDRLSRLGRIVTRLLGERQRRLETRRRGELLRLQERAIAASNHGVVIADATRADLPIIFTNKAFERLTGYSPEEVIGRNCRFLQGPETDPKTVEQIRMALREGREISVLLKNYRKDGTAFWNELSISPVRDGTLTHFVGIIADVTARKLSEERLTRSELLLSEAQSVARLGSFSWDVAAETLTWSEEMYRIFGFSVGSEVSVDRILCHVPEEDRAQLHAIMGEYKGQPPFFALDHRIILATGAERMVHLRGEAVRDASGNLLRIVGTVQDVTEARASEKALRESEARFHAIMDFAFDAVLTVDHEQRITDANRAAESLFGSSKQELVGQHMLATIIGDLQEEKRFGAVFADEAPVNGTRIEITARRADGARFPAELTITRVKVEGPALFTVFVRDLTDRNATALASFLKTQQALRHKDALLRLASAERESFSTFVPQILECVAQTVGIARVSFWCLLDPALSCQAVQPDVAPAIPELPELTASNFPGYLNALEKAQLLVVADAPVDPRLAEFRDARRTEKISSSLDIPIWKEGQLAGVIWHDHVGPPRTWTPEEQKFAASAGHLVALALAERDKQESERALRESEERFRVTFEQAAVGVGHFGIDGRWLWVNQRLCAIAGRSREELTKGSITDMVHPQHLADLQAGLEALRSGETETFSLDQLFVRKNGSTVWVNVTIGLAHSDGGEPLYFVPVVQDITERRRIEDRVLQQASLLDMTQDAILVRDLQDLILFWNHGAEVLYGISSRAAVGQPESALLYEDSTNFRAATKRVIEYGEWRGELRQRSRKTKKEIFVDARWTLLRDEAGEPQSILAIHTDITSRKSLEEQFLRAQRMESIGTLASGVAHDLNNILAPILMAIPMLRGPLPEQVRESILASMETSAQRGADIVRQVLTFARGVEGERTLLQPGHLLREMSTIVAETFPKTIATQCDIPRDLWTVNADATQLHQVLMNLCVNARDAMHEGGVLTIRAENTTLDESSAAMIPDAQAGPYVVLEVADTGSGIPKEVLAKIFDPFFTTKEQGKGTGLGLSTVMGIVKSHGGFLKVSSEVGRGTSFRAFVPASIDARLLEEPSLVRHFRRGSGELLLVVDDEASIRNVTSTMLRKHGYEVVLAGDGTEALALYVQRQAEISAVLTDVAMPHIDGVALTRALMRLNPKVRVIASTGFGDNARMAELRSLGAAAFLSKPFTTDKLLQVVHEVLHPCGAATAGDSMA